MSEPHFGLRLHRVAIVIAMAAANVAWGMGLADPSGTPEHLYLTFLAVAVLLPASALGPASTPVVAAAAVLVTVAQWTLPPGGTLAAAMGLLLTVAIVWTVAAAVRASCWRAPAALTVPAAFGLQALLRADELLRPALDVRSLVVLVALPLAAGLAAAVLSERGGRGALIGAATLLVLAPGWRVGVTLALAGLAAIELVRDRELPAALRWGGPLAVLLGAALWNPAFAGALAATMALQQGRTYRGRAAIFLLAAIAALVPTAPVPWPEASAALAWLFLLLPSLALLQRSRWPDAVVALALAFAAARWLVPAEALAAPALLLALQLRPDGPGARLQQVWSAFLLTGTAVTAAYPWLRSEPAAQLLGLVGLEATWRGALVVTALVAGVAQLCVTSQRVRRLLEGRLEPFALGVLALAALGALPPQAARPLPEVLTLDAGRRAWHAELIESAPVSAVVVDSYLSEGVRLAAGRPVAKIELRHDSATAFVGEIESGRDTGEWAARRPDVAALPDLETPRPWLSWVGPGGFFAQRYRARLEVPGDVEVDAVRITLLEDLPPEVSLALFHVELRP